MNYYVERTLQAVFTFWATITATFMFVKWMPGGPLDFILANMMGLSNIGGGASMQSLDPDAAKEFQQLAQLYVNINPAEPLWQQYLSYVTQMMQGDFGQSVWYGEPVFSVLGPAIPWTVFIGSIGLFISFMTRVIIGALLAYKEGSTFDISATTALIWGHTVPFYIMGLLFLYFFGYILGWFPTGGRANPNVDPALSYAYLAGVLNHAFLPILAVAWAELGSGALAMRANSIQVLGEDYVRVAQLRGLKTKRISLRYVARNAILPMYTSLLMGIGFVFGGSVILETIFNYPGVGYYMFRGIQARDYPLLMGGFVLITIALVLAMFIADLTYGYFDPRVKEGSGEVF